MFGLSPKIVPDAMLFDVDGTLYDQSFVRRRMLLRMLAHASIQPLDALRTVRILCAYRLAQERVRYADDSGSLAQLSLACEMCGVSPDRAKFAVAYWMEQRPLDLIGRSMRPGLLELLQLCRRRGIAIGAVSDYAAEQKLVALGIRQYFGAIISPFETPAIRFKPAPDGILSALDRLGVEPTAALYVGDRQDVDSEAARRAGVSVVIVNGQPDTDSPGTVRNFLQLRTCLGLGPQLMEPSNE